MSKKILGNPGAERAVLAGICQYGRDAYFDIADIISPNSFTQEANSAIYICLESLLKVSEKVDATSILAVADTLNLTGILTKNKTDLDFLRSIFNFPIHLSNVRTHAKQIGKLDLIRKTQASLIEAYHKLELFDGTESVDSIMAIPEDAVFTLTNELNSKKENSPQLVGEGCQERLEHLANNPIEMPGLPLPWKKINALLGGGLRQGVNLFGARAGIGKSTLAINGGLHLSEKMSIPTLYIDTEMVKEEQENRIVASLAQIDNKLIETGQFGSSPGIKSKVMDAATRLKTIPFYHRWVGGKNFEEIVSIMRRWIFSVVKFDENGNTNPHCIIYDYFKLMNDSNLENLQEHQAIGFQISHLSDFCKQYNTPCLAFVQLNRDGITKDTSDIISQSDRLLWLATSCCVFKEKDADEIVEDGRENGNRKLFALKCRFSGLLDQGNYINMELDGATSTIKELNTKFEAKKIQREYNEGFSVDGEFDFSHM